MLEGACSQRGPAWGWSVVNYCPLHPLLTLANPACVCSLIWIESVASSLTPILHPLFVRDLRTTDNPHLKPKTNKQKGTIMSGLLAKRTFVPALLKGAVTTTTTATTPRLSSAATVHVHHLPFARSVSSSPYGRTHVWKRRPKRLPNPIVPQFPQRVIRADGSSFTHWTTSPRSLIRLTRDVTNHPLWNVSALTGEGAAEESEVTGRLGRFQRKFVGEVDWMNEAEGLSPSNDSSTAQSKRKGG